MAKKRKNSRKKKKNHVQVPFPVVLANVLVLVAVLGLSYMWLCARCDALGRAIKSKEAELVKAQKHRNYEQEVWASMSSPSNLRRSMQRFGLDMQMPLDSQVVKIEHLHASAQTAMTDIRTRTRQ